MPPGWFVVFGCILLTVHWFTFLRRRACLGWAKGRRLCICSQPPPSIAVGSHRVLLPPSPSPNSSVPQHFCPLCQVPQTSASSTPALVLKNVSGKSLWPEWFSPPQTYSSLFWSPPSRTPLPAQTTCWTAISSDLNSVLLCLSLFPFSLHKTVTISQKKLVREWLGLPLISLPLPSLITPKSLPYSLHCRCTSFSSGFLQPAHDHLLNFPLGLLLHSFLLLKWKYRTISSS